MSKVTVAIPTYNRAEYLKECLRSVLQQSFQDFEIIIFDNCSDYDVSGLVKSFNDPKIKLLINNSNIGHLFNLNKILQYKFISPYVIVFHDDDTMHPELLAKEVALLEANPGAVFAVTGLQGIRNKNPMLIFQKIKDNTTLIFQNYADLVRLLLKHFDFCFDSIMYRSSVLSPIVDYDKKFFRWSDRPYFIDIAKRGTVAVVKAKLVNYRVHPGQGSQTEHSGEFAYFINLYNYYKICLPQPLSKQDTKLFYKWSTNNLILAISWFSPDVKTYFKLFKQCRVEGLFKWRYFNIRGLYYSLLVIKGFLFK